MMKFKLSENSVAPAEGDSEENPFVMKFDSKVYPRDVSALPDGLSVIYFFYSSFSKDDDKQYRRLLYIGQASDLKKRIRQHSKMPEGFPCSGSVEVKDLGDFLCDIDDVTRECYYTYARVDGRKLNRYEAAAIKVFKPVINVKNKKTLGCHVESWFKCAGVYAWKKDVVEHAEPDK